MRMFQDTNITLLTNKYTVSLNTYLCRQPTSVLPAVSMGEI